MPAEATIAVKPAFGIRKGGGNITPLPGSDKTFKILYDIS